MGPKSSGKRTKKSKDEFKLNKEDVLELGGDKKDLEMLQDLDDDVAEIVYKEDMDAEPVNRDELQAFVMQLGFDKMSKPAEDETISTSDEEQQDKDIMSNTSKKKQAITQDENDTEGNEVEEEKTPTPEPVLKKKKKTNKFKLQVEEVSSTTTPVTPSAGNIDFLAQPQQTWSVLLIKPGAKWYDEQFLNDPTVWQPLAKTDSQRMRSYAAKVYNDEINLYKTQQDKSKRSDKAWMRTVLASGTVADKMAALTLNLNEAPIHNLSCLDTLIAMVTKKGHREALMALDTIHEIFRSEFLPDDKKLKTFEQHPLSEVDVLASGNRSARDKRLLLWYYEEELKKRYQTFVQALQGLASDNLMATKVKAINVAYELLVSKPEQEKFLLTLIVNKLGDPDYKLASKASYVLSKIVERHPNMKLVVVLEVERLMYRPHITGKAQYYAICVLNQLFLGEDEAALASRLITIYFSFFKSFVKKGEINSKVLSALLTGVNRAFPYAKDEKEKIAEQVETLYKIVHIANFNTGTQALLLLYQVTDASDSVSDRFYQALYRKLLDPGLKTSKKQTVFLNLIYKSLKKDVIERRIKAFIKRLLQTCCHQGPQFICAGLIVISEVLKAKGDILNVSQLCEEEGDEHFADIKDEEIEAMKKYAGSSDEEGDGADDKLVNDVTKAANHEGHTTVAPSWVHKHNVKDHVKAECYDPSHRNPLFCRADDECVWELKLLAQHYHPSVSLFAKNILKSKPVEYSGDPMHDFTLIRFLDRFVYRNPKVKSEKDRRSTPSQFQLSSKCREVTGIRAIPVNTQEFLDKGEANIPEDEKFFFRYFQKQEAQLKQKTKTDDDSDVESVDDDAFDSFLDGYEKAVDEKDINFDFAGEFLKGKGKKLALDSDDEDEEDEEEGGDEELSDEEVDFAGDPDFMAALRDGDEEGEGEGADATSDQEEGEEDDDEDELNFSGEDDFADLDFAQGKKRKSTKDGPPGSKKSKASDGGGLFAAAEEFSHLMDENQGSKFDMISSEAFTTKDKASVKQISWESKRDQWVRGQDWKSRQQGRGGRGGAGSGRGGRGGSRGGGGGRDGDRDGGPPSHRGPGREEGGGEGGRGRGGPSRGRGGRGGRGGGGPSQSKEGRAPGGRGGHGRGAGARGGGRGRGGGKPFRGGRGKR